MTATNESQATVLLLMLLTALLLTILLLKVLVIFAGNCGIAVRLGLRLSVLNCMMSIVFC